MNDLSYINNYSDQGVLNMVGEFIKARRIEQGITQQELSDRAAISRSTLSLMERGENIMLLNLIKILRILDALYVLDGLQPQKQVSPLLLAREEKKKRQRATSKGGDAAADDLGW